MKYIRIILTLLACCMVSGCTTGEGAVTEDLVMEESVSDDVVSGQDLEEDASTESTDGKAVAEIAPGETEQTSEETVWPEQTIPDAGEVIYDHYERVCEACGMEIYAYYVESVIFSTEVIPCAEQINGILREEMETDAQQREEFLEGLSETYQNEWGADIETEGPEYACDNNHFVFARLFDTKYFTGAAQYVFEREGEEDPYLCLEVDFDGYSYMGGAHGVPYKQICLFDLDDGSIISVEDILNVSEEEFRTLAAEYAVEDFRENGEKYSLKDEDSIYEYVYEHVDFDYYMYFSMDGVVIVLFPYAIGSNATGYNIPITIPYEELGIRLADAYGVDITPSDGEYFITW